VKKRHLDVDYEVLGSSRMHEMINDAAMRIIVELYYYSLRVLI
jgi:hypothetical protein